MGFQFGKQQKNLSVESETVQRWRKASTRPGERAEALETLRELPKVDWGTRIDHSPAETETAQVSLFEVDETADLAFQVSEEDDDFDDANFPDERVELTAQIESVSKPRSNPAKPKLTPVELTEEIKTALGPGTIIEGKFSFQNPVRIDGTLKGEVHSSSLLIVGENALIEATVEVGTLVVHGEVRGNVIAEELVEIHEGGCLRGDIQTNRIVIHDGAEFQGRVSER